MAPAWYLIDFSLVHDLAEVREDALQLPGGIVTFATLATLLRSLSLSLSLSISLSLSLLLSLSLALSLVRSLARLLALSLFLARSGAAINH